MSWYELLLFLHIVGAVAWLGAGALFTVLAVRAERTRDDEGLERLARDSADLSLTYFVPASLATFVFGVLLTIDGPWGLDQLWLVMGLAGYAATFLTGVLVMKPSSERIAAMIERDGGSTPESTREIRRLLIKGRADLVVLYLVLATMALKPTGDDVALLAVMAALLVGALGYVAVRLKAVDAEAPAPAALAG